MNAERDSGGQARHPLAHHYRRKGRLQIVAILSTPRFSEVKELDADEETVSTVSFLESR